MSFALEWREDHRPFGNVLFRYCVPFLFSLWDAGLLLTDVLCCSGLATRRQVFRAGGFLNKMETDTGKGGVNGSQKARQFRVPVLFPTPWFWHAPLLLVPMNTRGQARSSHPVLWGQLQYFFLHAVGDPGMVFHTMTSRAHTSTCSLSPPLQDRERTLGAALGSVTT